MFMQSNKLNLLHEASVLEKHRGPVGKTDVTVLREANEKKKKKKKKKKKRFFRVTQEQKIKFMYF